MLNEKLNLYIRSPLCTIATVHDYLLLNGYEIPLELVHLAGIRTLFLAGEMMFKNIPLSFVSVIENVVDISIFQDLGFSLSYHSIDEILTSNDFKSFISHSDYRTLYSKTERYNICPIHSILVIEVSPSDSNNIIINDVVYNQSNKEIATFAEIPKKLLITANKAIVYPYLTNEVNYTINKIDKDLVQNNLEKRILKNLQNIIISQRQDIEVAVNKNAKMFYGKMGYAYISDKIKNLTSPPLNLESIKQKKEYFIILMILRRFFLPQLGKGDFFRSELAKSLYFYGYTKSDEAIIQAAKQLNTTSEKWERLPQLLVVMARCANERNINKIEILGHEFIKIFQDIIEIENNVVETLSFSRLLNV